MRVKSGIVILIFFILLPVIFDMLYQRVVWFPQANIIEERVRDTNDLDLSKFEIITAANSYYFGELENLIGSIHLWEPQKRIVVYDLGLEDNQLLSVKNWCNVELIRFPYEQFPVHLSHLYEYAWKPPIIATEFFKCDAILWLDAGDELRRPLNDILKILMTETYWTHGWDKLCRLSHRGLFNYYNIVKTEFCSTQKPKMIEANALAAKRGGKFDIIIRKAMQCALDQTCIAPKDATLENHRFDQSVYSLLMALNNLTVQSGIKIKCCNVNNVPKDEKLQTDVHIMLRRKLSPKPFTKYLCLKNSTQT